jgi:hypothetical protein
MLAGWLPGRITDPVVVVAGPVVVDATLDVVGTRVVVGPVVGGMLVVGTMLVVVTSVVVGVAVVGAAVVVGLAVVGGAVAVRWVVVVLPADERAVRVVAPPTLAGRAVVTGPLMAPCPGAGVVEGGGAVGSRSPVVVVDAAVGAGVVDEVGSATPGARGGGWGWGIRVAEASRAARIAVVSPKTNSSSRQGRRGPARCRGGGVGMVHRPGSAGSSGAQGVHQRRPPTGCIRRSPAQQVE